jgi:hypothetical protein
VVARQPDISIGTLIEVLGISKQAVNRPLGLLLQRKLLTSKRSPAQHRSKLLRLTESGKRTEQRASGYERAVLRAAFDDDAKTWFHISPLTGDIIGRVDSSRRHVPLAVQCASQFRFHLFERPL